MLARFTGAIRRGDQIEAKGRRPVGREVRKEEIDYEQFVDEAQFFLAQIRGDGVDDDEALARTVRSYPAVSEMDVRGWARDPAFQRTLRHAREMGAENRAYDERMAAKRSPDPFSTPPRPGMVDVAAESYDVTTPKPPGALSRWLRRLGIEVEWQHSRRDEPRPSAQREISQDEMTEADWAGVRAQNAQALQRAQAEQDAARPDNPGAAWQGQAWSRKTEWMSPDGSAWQGAPAQQAGGLFSPHGDPDSVPTP